MRELGSDLADLYQRIQECLQKTDSLNIEDPRYEVYQEVADAFLQEKENPSPYLKCVGCGGEGLGVGSVGHTTPKCVFVQLCRKWGIPVQVSN